MRFTFLIILVFSLVAGCDQRPSSKQAQLPPASPGAVKSEKALAIPTPELEQPSIQPSRAVPFDASVKFAEETFVPVAQGQLYRIWSALLSDQPLDHLVDETIRFTRLRPASTFTIEHAPFRIVHADGASGHPDWKVSRAAFQQEGARLVENFSDRSSVHFSVHTIQVEQRDSQIETRMQVELSGPRREQLIEQNAIWKLTWTLPADARSPKLSALQVESFEEVELIRSTPWFHDTTESIMRGTAAWGAQLSLSNTYWQSRIERHHLIDKVGHHGLAVGDLDGDGLEDVYVCQPGGLPNRLFLRQPDGSVRDASAEYRCDLLDNSRSALIIDFDNSGTQDLIVATASGLVLFKNSGRAPLQLANHLPALVDAYSLAATDYDADGDLDIYACRYYPADADPLSLPMPTPYFDARNGGENFLVRNDGQFRTSNATSITGLDQNNQRYSFAAIWIDYDSDGDQDLYVANDFGRNNLYRNDSLGPQIHFTDVAEDLGMRDGAFGMSATGGDFDRDGHEDIYVANMFSSAGSRIARLDDFKPGISNDRRAQFLHLARGNTLFHNQAGRAFHDVSGASGTMLGRWSWGSNFVDFDNDGWLDLIVANGYLTGERADDDL